MIKLLLIIIYTTIIFILPNQWPIFTCLMFLQLILSVIWQNRQLIILKKLLHIAPFIIITFILNVWLEDLSYALFMMTKFLLCCHIIFCYSQTISTLQFAHILARMLAPLKKLNFDTDSLILIVCISLSLIPIFKANLRDTKSAIRAKGITQKAIIIQQSLINFLNLSWQKITQLDDALVAKGIFEET